VTVRVRNSELLVPLRFRTRALTRARTLSSLPFF
jgi:hypothetical protein